MFYTFKVLARNAFGTSAYTETIVILCAEEPAKPDAPTTLRENNNFIIDWVAPSDNGSEILSYTVYLGMSDLTFSLELSSCDGSDLGIIEQTQCTITQDVLKAAPFNLIQGNSVYAKLYVTNQFGDSLMSEVGNGGLICNVPTAPLNLANDATVTSYSEIGLVWEPCENDGGDLVIDYELYFTTQDSYTFELIQSGLITTTYTTVKPLVTGTTYKFFVKARNTVGVGAMSNTVSILMA